MLVRLAVRGFVIEAESPNHRGDVENKLCARISELQKKHDESEIHIAKSNRKDYVWVARARPLGRDWIVAIPT